MGLSKYCHTANLSKLFSSQYVVHFRLCLDNNLSTTVSFCSSEKILLSERESIKKLAAKK